jgi:hypothetical protein
MSGTAHHLLAMIGPKAASPGQCVRDTVALNLRATVFGPASTKTQAVVGAVVTLALLIGFGLTLGADSAVFTALLIGLAVLMIGLKRSDTARR